MLHAVWNYLFGWAGLDFIVGAIAVAIAILEPKQLDAITDLRKWAIGVAVVAFTFMGIEAHGYKLGYDEVQRRWNAALAVELANGEKARADAERAVDPDTSDRSLYDNDKRNRDAGEVKPKPAGPVRWLEGNHLFRKKGHSRNHKSNPTAQPNVGK